jgi:hypothetical protein
VGGRDVQTSGGSKSFFGRPTLKGRKLFEIENKDAIDAAAKAMAEKSAEEAGAELPATKVPFKFKFYQPALKKMWDALNEFEQASFTAHAKELVHDVAINQAAFTTSIWGDMDDFAKSGVLGDRFVMGLFFGWRTIREDSVVQGR